MGMWDKRRVVGALILLSTWVVLWLTLAKPAQPADTVEFRYGCWYGLVDAQLRFCEPAPPPYLEDPEVAPGADLPARVG